jgi:hypothetical protein
MRQMCLGEWGGAPCVIVRVGSSPSWVSRTKQGKFKFREDPSSHTYKPRGSMQEVPTGCLWTCTTPKCIAHGHTHASTGREGERRQEASTHDPHDALLRERERDPGLTRCQEGGHGQHAQREAQLGDATHVYALWFVWLWVWVCGCMGVGVPARASDLNCREGARVMMQWAWRGRGARWHQTHAPSKAWGLLLLFICSIKVAWH